MRNRLKFIGIIIVIVVLNCLYFKEIPFGKDTPEKAISRESSVNKSNELYAIKQEVDIVELKNGILYMFVSDNDFLNIAYLEKSYGTYKVYRFTSFIGKESLIEDGNIETYDKHVVTESSVIEITGKGILYDVRYPSEEPVYIDGIKAQTKDYVVTLDGKACPVQLVYAVIEE